MMNLRDFGIVFAFGAIATGLVIAFIALFGCRSTMPEEPPFTETVAANVRDR